MPAATPNRDAVRDCRLDRACLFCRSALRDYVDRRACKVRGTVSRTFVLCTTDSVTMGSICSSFSVGIVGSRRQESEFRSGSGGGGG